MRNTLCVTKIIMSVFLNCSIIFAQQTFWNQLNISLNEYIYGMTVTPQGKIFVGTSNGVYCTNDTGKTWIARKSGLPTTSWVVSITSDAEGTVYAGINSWGIYKLSNVDTTWVEMNSGLTKKNISYVAVHPIKHIVYAGTYNSGSFLWKETDTAWSPMDTSLNDGHIGCFLVDTLNKNVFAGTWSGVFRSTDDGGSWARVGNTTAFVITTMAVNSKGYIFAGSSNYGIFRSTNNGINWEPKNTMMFDSLVSNLLVNPKDIIYTSTSMGVFYSTNDGDSWTQISGILSRVSFLTFDSENYLYAGTQSGRVYRSKISTTTGVNSGIFQTPSDFELYQNYPNPFNPTTVISYQLPVNSFVTLKVYDMLGREVVTLVNEKKGVGNYFAQWNASAFPSGVYFYRLEANEKREMKKMVLVK
ncbi:MAG: T9SS type A sorting domain-containing protein [Bacteroidota bacterium]|nr:T9SS type A sorting domain-containing protein [Bacteroidota bacterium]